jgi:transcription termination factor Rho
MSKNIMNLTELKSRPAAKLVELGQSLGLEDLARHRKQEIIFSILKAHAKNGLASCAQPMGHTWQVLTTFTSARARFDALVCAPATPLPD